MTSEELKAIRERAARLVMSIPLVPAGDDYPRFFGTDLPALLDSLARLAAENERLREALGTFADTDNWLWAIADDGDDVRWVGGEDDEPWHIARAALAKGGA